MTPRLCAPSTGTRPGIFRWRVFCAWGWLLLWLWMGGCAGASRDSGRGEDTGQGGAPTFSPRFAAHLEAEALRVVIRAGQGGSWWMGFAETDPVGRNPWRGEDCFQGDQVSGVPVVYCHRVSETGGSLRYGGDAAALDADVETALASRSGVGGLTFYFYEVLSDTCWVGGDDPSHYADLCERVVTISVSR